MYNLNQVERSMAIWRLKVGLGDLREKIICKQCKNEATSKILHRVNSLICKPNKMKSPLATVV